MGIGVEHVFGCGGAAGNLLGLDVWLVSPSFLSKSHMRCSSLWSQRLAVTAASTADAPPQVSCGRDGTGRAGRTTKAMCGRTGSLRPAQGQGDQGRAANCCALREAGQGLGTIELRGGGITGPEEYTFLSNLAILFCLMNSLIILRALFNHLSMYILSIYYMCVITQVVIIV